METMSNSLFQDESLNCDRAPIAGIPGLDLCVTAVGGTITYCYTKTGTGTPDNLMDSGE